MSDHPGKTVRSDGEETVSPLNSPSVSVLLCVEWSLYIPCVSMLLVLEWSLYILVCGELCYKFISFWIFLVYFLV